MVVIKKVPHSGRGGFPHRSNLLGAHWPTENSIFIAIYFNWGLDTGTVTVADRPMIFLLISRPKRQPRSATVMVLVSKPSDGHRFENPCRYAGTGLTGTGAGHQIVTRDIPVPVWAGDGL